MIDIVFSNTNGFDESEYSQEFLDELKLNDIAGAVHGLLPHEYAFYPEVDDMSTTFAVLAYYETGEEIERYTVDEALEMFDIEEPLDGDLVLKIFKMNGIEIADGEVDK